MSGTKEGSIKAIATMYAKYGEDHFEVIGRQGGKLGTTGGFGQGKAGKARARTAGRLGGKNSKRTAK